jgi:hypothetical protein
MQGGIRPQRRTPDGGLGTVRARRRRGIAPARRAPAPFQRRPDVANPEDRRATPDKDRCGEAGRAPAQGMTLSAPAGRLSDSHIFPEWRMRGRPSPPLAEREGTRRCAAPTGRVRWFPGRIGREKEFPHLSPTLSAPGAERETTRCPARCVNAMARGERGWGERNRLPLREAALPWKMRRQHPIGRHVADFACPARRLVIEIDGGQHAVRSADDARRSAALPGPLRPRGTERETIPARDRRIP